MTTAAVTMEAGLDLPHGPFDDPRVAENYQWLAADESGITVICHLGTHPSDRSLWHTVSAVSLPGGDVYVAKSVGHSPDDRTAGTTLHRVTCREPFRAWSFAAGGGFQQTSLTELGAGLLRDGRTTPVEIDAEFESFGPVWNPAGSDAQPEWGSFHLEQPMRVRGRIVVAGEVHLLDGYGYRDHSRGHRDLRNVEHSFWCNGTFPSGRVFATLQVTNRDGHTESRAAVRDGDRFVEAELVRPPRVHGACHEPLDLSIDVRDHRGIEHRIDGRVVGGATWSIVGGSEFCVGAAIDEPDAYLLPQSVIEWRWDDETGFGLADRCGLTSHLMRDEEYEV